MGNSEQDDGAGEITLARSLYGTVSYMVIDIIDIIKTYKIKHLSINSRFRKNGIYKVTYKGKEYIAIIRTNNSKFQQLNGTYLLEPDVWNQQVKPRLGFVIDGSGETWLTPADRLDEIKGLGILIVIGGKFYRYWDKLVKIPRPELKATKIIQYNLEQTLEYITYLPTNMLVQIKSIYYTSANKHNMPIISFNGKYYSLKTMKEMNKEEAEKTIRTERLAWNIAMIRDE